MQLKDGPTYKHVRHGIMEWVRRRNNRERRMQGDMEWNSEVMGAIGRGPPVPTTEDGVPKHVTPSEAKAYAAYAVQRMRITSGCRTGIIAGGPQGEQRMERAARAAGSAAEFIMNGGCRGCMAKGMWPGVKETSEHCLLDCACKDVNRDLIRWKEDMAKHLTYMAQYASKLQQDASTLAAQLQLALRALTTVGGGRDTKEYEALRHTVGGKLPRWDHNEEMRDKKHNKALTNMVVRLQNLYIERLNDWTSYAAPHGWNRQKRWGHREWTRLIFGALKHNVIGRTARMQARRRIFDCLMTVYRNVAERNVLVAWRYDERCRKYAKRRALRRVIWALMDVYSDEDGWVALV